MKKTPTLNNDSTTILAQKLIAKTNKLIIQSLILIQESKKITEKGKRV